MLTRPLAAALVLFTSGCATIMHGSKQDIAVSSTPSGAAVSVDNQQMGVTPTTVNLTRKDKHVISIDAPGYKRYDLQLTRGTSGWVWGNLVFGGIPGLAVDAITGSLYKLSPDNINATLERSGTASMNSAGTQLHVVLVYGADPSWQKVGQLERDF
jgi:hypothetical protein